LLNALKIQENFQKTSMLKNRGSKRSSFYIFKITLVASVRGFLFGYCLAIIAGALSYRNEYF